MSLSICLGTIGAHNLFDGSPNAYLEIATMADQAGIDQIVFTDHVIMGENLDAYPFGDFPLPLDYPWYEPLTLLSAIAAVTSNIRLATGVLISPLRPAALLAKITSTIDHLSNGRLDLGVGTGWQKEEYLAQGMDFDSRWQMLDEQLDNLKALWANAPASISINDEEIKDLHSIPLAYQKRGVPLWFGIAPLKKNVERIAQHGTGWIPIRTSPEYIHEGVQLIRTGFESAGRNPGSLKVRAHVETRPDEKGGCDLEYSIDQIAKQQDAGATHVEFELVQFCQNRDQILPFLERISDLKQ